MLNFCRFACGAAVMPDCFFCCGQSSRLTSRWLIFSGVASGMPVKLHSKTTRQPWTLVVTVAACRRVVHAQPRLNISVLAAHGNNIARQRVYRLCQQAQLVEVVGPCLEHGAPL